MMLMLYSTSDAEEMKSIINRTRNMQQENPRRPYDHTVQKSANLECPTWVFFGWNFICNGVIVIQGKEVVD